MRARRRALGALVAMTAIVAGTSGVGAHPGDHPSRDELARVRQATVRYHDVQAAYDDGYELLDVCFDDEANGAGMGFHLVKGIGDTTLDPLAPEALVYEPAPDGTPGRLVGVEYIVPMELSPQAPEVMGVRLHENEALGLWVLHAWIWRGNPDGVLADFNPTVAMCP